MHIDKGIKYILKPYLQIIFILTALGSWQAFITHNTWHMGDWLINYQGGFVRRGLLGELIYQLSLYTTVSPGFYVFLTQNLFIALFLLFSFLLLKKQRSLAPYVMLIFSPFIFAFQINGFDQIESQGGYFKDIIYYSLLAFIGYSAAAYQVKTFEKIYYLTLLCYPLLILTHEVFALFLPYIVIMYLIKVDIDRKKIFINVTMLTLSIISFIFCIVFSGNNIQVIAIYNSLLSKYTITTYGSIGWLGLSLKVAFERVLIQVYYNSYFKNYGIILLLSSIAFYPVRKQLKFILKNKLSLCLFFLTLMGTFFLCCIAIDWGRFIRFNLVSLFILSLLAGAIMTQKSCELETNHRTNTQSENHPLYLSLLLLFTLGYATLWRIPSCCNYRPPVSGFKTNNLFWSYQPFKKIIYDITKRINSV